ncbi:hypothetical protein [Desulfovibrio oxyclinae]|uniref:hypothetical protein n=1 Tax=Desulfovibrio oxyclinae TaxID=63560 RepID=UPI00037D745D|nr:hypothetical protein [Desulfovibrio oxyclinae]
MVKTKDKPIPAIPPLDEELIKALETRFPERCPKLTDSDRDIWFYAGKRAVVKFLSETYEEQQEERL